MTSLLCSYSPLSCSEGFNPATFFDREHDVWRGPASGDGLKGEIDQDERSLVCTQLDWTKIKLGNHFKEGEASITGEEMLERAKEARYIRFGGNVFLSLWRDYESHDVDSVLEWLHLNRNVEFLCFLGVVLRYPAGGRHVPCLYRSLGKWYRARYLLGVKWSVEKVYAFSAE